MENGERVVGQRIIKCILNRKNKFYCSIAQWGDYNSE